MARTLNNKSMNQLILDHLVQNGSISAVEAQALYRCRSLSRRICDLKAAGFNIVSTLKADRTGQRYARYEMLSKSMGM